MLCNIIYYKGKQLASLLYNKYEHKNRYIPTFSQKKQQFPRVNLCVQLNLSAFTLMPASKIDFHQKLTEFVFFYILICKAFCQLYFFGSFCLGLRHLNSFFKDENTFNEPNDSRASFPDPGWKIFLKRAQVIKAKRVNFTK